jgi:hypothetical protein
MPSVNSMTVTQSPASTGSHEDDHSQRLLDHWLNANHSLAVGSINGQAPPLDPAGLGYLPMPPLPQGLSEQFSFGNFTPAPVPGMQPWSDPSLPQMHSGVPVPNPAPDTFGFGGPQQFGSTGLEGALSGTGVVAPSVEGENSDDYWNALIDGEFQIAAPAKGLHRVRYPGHYGRNEWWWHGGNCGMTPQIG